MAVDMTQEQGFVDAMTGHLSSRVKGFSVGKLVIMNMGVARVMAPLAVGGQQFSFEAIRHSEMCEFLRKLFGPEKLPYGCEIQSCDWNATRRCMDFLVQHHEFPEVPPGNQISFDSRHTV